ncbi:hypothetical protein [Nodularia sphaerocarpa]|nr:hypothetical protein [Nodularia sphaerocarpa]MDB9374542.1 hypothetical protein [Nodularia sphaerocarpa CS-585]MDB9379157.1 hypothetical protein [Nodularia sphaerocarpa CS-585A2]
MGVLLCYSSCEKAAAYYTHLLFWHSPHQLQSRLDAPLLWGLPPEGFST